MIGGDAEVVERLKPIYAALAPSVDSAPRTPGRSGDRTPARRLPTLRPGERGHFVKILSHDEIEYGLMAAYAEGLNHPAHRARDKAPLRRCRGWPLARPGLPNTISTCAESPVWRRGSVISSWLLDLTATALQHNPELSEFTGHVSDSGEGRWTLEAATDESVPAPILATALGERFASAARPASPTGSCRDALRLRRTPREGPVTAASKSTLLEDEMNRDELLRTQDATHALGLPPAIRACLFNLDGVLARTAKLHIVAWKQMFDEYLQKRSLASQKAFIPFDAVSRLRPATSTASSAWMAAPARSSTPEHPHLPMFWRRERSAPTPQRSTSLAAPKGRDLYVRTPEEGSVKTLRWVRCATSSAVTTGRPPHRGRVSRARSTVATC